MKRSDGVLIKGLDPLVELSPYLMERRSAAQIFSKRVYDTEAIDRYILEKKAQGHKISYLHIFLAAYVRVIAERPQLNRFIMNSRVYQRNTISISMVVKRSFREDGEETTVKFEFSGKETIFEIAEVVDRTIAEAITKAGATETDDLLAKFAVLPGMVKKLMVAVLKGMDKVNLLPESVIKVSPFHTTLFFTHLKSINTDYLYHHLYDIGTAGIFIALGKTAKLPVVVKDELVIKNCIQVGYTSDERICDGVYFARSMKLVEKYLEAPQLLEAGPEGGSAL